MRLTVRTLLAWIDGVLGPDDQRTLGEKVAASDVAPRLVERTNAVVAHPGVAAPAPDGRGLADDPNTTAEFLDNVLLGERLQAFERVCIESDMHLAEAAACHRLLAEITRDPQVVEPLDDRQRRKLLDAVARHGSEPAAASMGGAAEERLHAAVPPAGAGRSTPVAVPAAGGASRRQSRRAPLAAWISAAAALGLLLVLGGFLVWSLTRGPARRGPKVGEVAAVSAAPDHVQEKPAPTPAATVEPPTEHAAVAPVEDLVEAPQAAVPPVVVAPVAEPAPVAALPPDEPPPPVPAEPSVGPPPIAAAAVDRRVPNGDALAIVAAPAAPAEPAMAPAEPPAGEQPPAANAPRAAAAQASGAASVGEGGPLLHLVEGEGAADWRPLGAGAALADRENLLAPPWCHPLITVDGVTIRLQPGTRAVLTRDTDGTPRLEVVFGRAVVGGEAAAAKLGVMAGGLCGVLSGVMRQPAGIEVAVERDPGGDLSAAQPRRRATLFAGSAEKLWRATAADGGAADTPLAGIPAEVLVAPRATLAWEDRDPAAGIVGPPLVEPGWMRTTAGIDRTERAAARALAGRLAATADAGVEKPLRELAADRRAENRMIAAATLALVGDYDELVVLLCDESPRGMLTEAQWTMLEELTVPLALARGENAAAKLGEAFQKRGPAGKGDALVALARGFSDDELAAGDDARLVEALDDGSLAVRRYAIRRLIEIVQPDARQRTAFRADRPAGMRKDGIAWWKAQLEQGRIRRGPLPAGSSPPAASGAPKRDDE